LPGCNITEQQSTALLEYLLTIDNIVFDLSNGRRGLEEAPPILKERLVDLVRIYFELVPNCKDAVPAVQQRVHKILAHMGGPEYVLKTAFTIVLKRKNILIKLLMPLRLATMQGVQMILNVAE
jgi:hypothetical protein